MNERGGLVGEKHGGGLNENAFHLCCVCGIM